MLVREIDFLNKKLEKTFPKTHLREIATQSKQPATLLPRRQKQGLTDLDKLEYELQHIEHKLQTLE